MKKNVILFTWEEKFLLLKDLRLWKKKFEEKYWKWNIFSHFANDLDVWEVKNNIRSSWLFVSNKLVIIYWIPKDTSPDNNISWDSNYKTLEEFLINDFEKISDETVVFLVSYSPDKRTKWYKFFSSNCVVKSYDLLKEKEIVKFVWDRIWTKVISNDVIDYFLEKVWTDLFAIDNELCKLEQYTEYKKVKIDKNLVDDICIEQSFIESFKVIDTMLTDPIKSIKLIDKLHNEWENELQFMWLIYWTLKSTLSILDLYESWLTGWKEIASELKLHPFVVMKTIKMIKRYKENKQSLIDFFNKLILLDSDIKTWIRSSSNFWLEIKYLIYNFKFE